jgi:hypothetical protein
LDPAPPDAGPPAKPLLGAVAEGDAMAVDEDMPQAAVSPITADVSAAATIHRLLFDVPLETA